MENVVYVSICMITYNHENYIAKAIEGVLKQKTNFDFELIIGEDCSTDSTKEIVEKYKNQYPEKIKIITSERKVGMILNLIRTLESCRGKYIAFCEGDDYWTDTSKLQKQVDFLESNPDFAMCSHAVKTVFEGVKEKNPFLKPLEISTFEDIVNHGHFIPTLSIVFRRSALPKIPFWFKDLWIGDIPLILLVTHYGKNYYIDKIMGVKRKHQGGITQQSERKTRKFKEYSIVNTLFFYKKLNKFFGYEHKKVLNPIIAKHHLYVMYNNFKNRKYFESVVNLFYSLYYSRKIFLQNFIKNTINQKKYKVK